MPFGKTCSVRESAEYLHVSTKTIRRYVKKGLLKHKLVEGKHGGEILIYKASLDIILGQIQAKSKGKEDVVEVARLFQEASQEVKEVVLKILRSSVEGKEEKRNNGLIASLFRWKDGDYQ